MRNTCLCISSNAHGCVPLKLDFLPSKQMVNLFQGEVSCFRVEEPDEREKAEVEDCDKMSVRFCKYYCRDRRTGKIDVSLVSDVVNRNWGDFNHQESADPYTSR